MVRLLSSEIAWAIMFHQSSLGNEGIVVERKGRYAQTVPNVMNRYIQFHQSAAPDKNQIELSYGAHARCFAGGSEAETRDRVQS